MAIFDDNIWWQFLMTIFLTIFDDNLFWQFLMTVFYDNFYDSFDDNFWWQFLMTIFNDNFWWQFWQFWKFLTNFDNFDIFLTIFYNSLYLLKFFTTETIFDNFDNWEDSPWRLLTFETLIIILTNEMLNSDNQYYLTINCDSGPHLQFLQCL